MIGLLDTLREFNSIWNEKSTVGRTKEIGDGREEKVT